MWNLYAHTKVMYIIVRVELQHVTLMKRVVLTFVLLSTYIYINSTFEII